MHEQRLAGGEVIGRDLTGKLHPSGALPFELLQDEPLAAEEHAPEALVEADGGRDPFRPAHPAVTMHEVTAGCADLEREDPAGHLGGKGDHALAAGCLVPGEEDARSRHDALQASEQSTAAALLPAHRVVWVICTLAVIHDSSPWSEMRTSPGSRIISRTGNVEPFTSACIVASPL